MEKENKQVLGGFETILDNFIPKTTQEDNIEILKNNVENEEQIEDPVISKMKKDKVLDQEQSVEDEEDEVEDNESLEDEEESKEVKTTKTTKSANTSQSNNKEDNQQDDDTQTDESEIVSGFFNAIAEKLGWEGITEDETPNTVDELINYFSEIIEQESKPQYASEEVEALDNFVKQGGDLKEYLKIDAQVNLDNIDLDDENNQKLIVKQLLLEKGFNEKQINKKIEKYIDAGLLEDEAQDALEDLKEINEQKKEQLLKEQKTAYENYVKQQRAFYNNVVDEIKNLNNIRGIAIPEKDKKVLIDYILKPDTDGMTKYQKDYRKGGIKNLIESAYFTMNADKLINSAKREGNNSAIEKLKRNLKNTSINTKTRSANTNKRDDDTIWGSFTRHLRMS